MNDNNIIDRFVKEPSLLVELCRDVIDQLDACSEDTPVAEQEAQLRAIAKAVEQLEKLSVPVPDSLRAEKTRLVALLAIHTDAKKSLAKLAGELEALLNDLKERLGQTGDPTIARKPRPKRSTLPKTENATWRQHIITVLKRLGGRGKRADVLDEIELIMKGKFLPGDLELRSDGKTIAWRNNTQWERYQMTQDGTLRSDSPNGIWELGEGNR